MSYELLQTIWFVLVFVLLAGYAILDGFDLGVGMWHLFSKDDRERRLGLNAIGPVWDGNEVWLLTGGGALFAAFPPVYALLTSSLYLAIVLLTVASLLPFYFIYGFELPSVGTSFEAGLEWTVEVTERLVASFSTAPFWLALIASSALMMLSLMIYSFVQAGSFAILNRGDRGAEPGAAPPVAGFRAFSWAEFQRLAGAYLWRFFWLFNLIMLFWMGWILLVVLSAFVIALAGSAAGLAAGVGLGGAARRPRRHPGGRSPRRRMSGECPQLRAAVAPGL